MRRSDWMRVLVVAWCAGMLACSSSDKHDGNAPGMTNMNGAITGSGGQSAGAGSGGVLGGDSSPGSGGTSSGGSGGAAAHMPGGGDPDADDGGMLGGAGDAGGVTGSDGGTLAPPATMPIPAPVADDCITDVSAGDHSFTCSGNPTTFLVMVDEKCTQFACGLIFDVHGAAMSGEIMRQDTHLHELAPPKGYITVHPSASGGSWDLVGDPPAMADFMTRMIKAFHVDEWRVHVTGFSMGSAVTFWFLCNHRDALASTAPVTGSSAEQVTVAGSDMPCIESIDGSWQPRVPILFMSGAMDTALTIENARARTEGIVMRLGLTGGDEVAGDSTYTRKRWTGDGGMMFDFLEHQYSNSLLAGHCIPGGDDGGFTSCTDGGSSLKWGEVALQWFLDHPKR